MPTLARASPDRELERLIRLYLRAETDIINEIGRLRSQGLVDYHAVAALERVQAILRQLETQDWEYVPRLVEAQFYVRRPDARAVPGETVEKHRAGYLNAKTLTSTQTDIVQRLTMNLMGQLTDAHSTVLAGLQSALLGRTEPDIYRRVGLEQVAAQQAAGRGINQSVPAFVDALRREGVTAFTDKAGRNWSLHTYATMVSRSTSRQAEILSVITADPEQDLYQISTHGTTCALCAPYEGRVYSRNGKDPDFPPLSDALARWTLTGRMTSLTAGSTFIQLPALPSAHGHQQAEHRKSWNASNVFQAQRRTPTAATRAPRSRSKPTAPKRRAVPSGCVNTGSGRSTAPRWATRCPRPLPPSSGTSWPGMKNIRLGERLP